MGFVPPRAFPAGFDSWPSAEQERFIEQQRRFLDHALKHQHEEFAGLRNGIGLGLLLWAAIGACVWCWR